MKIHACTNGVSTIAMPKLGSGLDQTNWQEVVKRLRDIFAYADVQIVVYTPEENGVHTISAEGDAEFYGDDEVERYSEEFVLENRELETDFTTESKSCNQPVRSNSQSFAGKITTIDSLITILNTSQRNSQATLKNLTSCTQTLQTKKWYSWLIC